METVMGKGYCADGKSFFNDVADALRQTFPTSPEVAFDDFQERFGRNVVDVFVSQVSHSVDGAFFHRPLDFFLSLAFDGFYFKASVLVFFDYLGFVYLDFFRLKCGLDNV